MGSIQQLQPRVRELPVGGNSGQVLTKGADNSVAWETPVTSSYTAGEGISVADGEISVTAATGTTFGGIKVGSGLTISNGFLSATGVSITIDSTLSDDSVNPVQNLVITTALNGKANTAHTHEIAHVTNLQTSLNGKSNTGHTHTYSEIDDPPAIPDIPTAVSAFTNDSGYLTTHQDISSKANVAATLAGYGITDAYTKAEVDTKVASVYKFQGSLSTFASLPASGNVVGDVYNVTDTGANYAWTGTEWDSLGIIVDLSVYATTTALNSGLLGKANSTHYHSASDVTSGQLALARIPTGTTASTVSLGDHVHTATATGNMGNVALRMGGDAVIVEAGNNVTVSSRYDSYDNEYFLTIAATDTTYSAATTTTGGLLSAADKVKLDGIQTGATAVSVADLLVTGTPIGTITVNGSAYTLKAPTAEESVTYTAGAGLTLSGSQFSVTANTYAPISHEHTAAEITSGLATIATSGSYNDLADTPTIPAAYTLPPATASTLGGVKVGTNLSINGSNVLSATNTTYSAATTSTAGLMSAADKTKLNGIATGANNYTYTLPTATTSTLGGVKVDGSTVTITDGVISASGGGGSFSWSTAPIASTSTGTAGELAYDSDYLYICVAANTWKRATLSTWEVPSYSVSGTTLTCSSGDTVSGSTVTVTGTVSGSTLTL